MCFAVLLSQPLLQETECPLSRQIPGVKCVFRVLSSAVGEGGFLQETVPLVTREEVFAGKAAQEEEDSPEVALPGQVRRSAVQCNTTLCWAPTTRCPAGKPGSWGQVVTGLPSGSGRVRKLKGLVLGEYCQELNTSCSRSFGCELLCKW